MLVIIGCLGFVVGLWDALNRISHDTLLEVNEFSPPGHKMNISTEVFHMNVTVPENLSKIDNITNQNKLISDKIENKVPKKSDKESMLSDSPVFVPSQKSKTSTSTKSAKTADGERLVKGVKGNVKVNETIKLSTTTISSVKTPDFVTLSANITENKTLKKQLKNSTPTRDLHNETLRS